MDKRKSVLILFSLIMLLGGGLAAVNYYDDLQSITTLIDSGLNYGSSGNIQFNQDGNFKDFSFDPTDELTRFQVEGCFGYGGTTSSSDPGGEVNVYESSSKTNKLADWDWTEFSGSGGFSCQNKSVSLSTSGGLYLEARDADTSNGGRIESIEYETFESDTGKEILITQDWSKTGSAPYRYVGVSRDNVMVDRGGNINNAASYNIDSTLENEREWNSNSITGIDSAKEEHVFGSTSSTSDFLWWSDDYGSETFEVNSFDNVNEIAVGQYSQDSQYWSNIVTGDGSDVQFGSFDYSGTFSGGSTLYTGVTTGNVNAIDVAKQNNEKTVVGGSNGNLYYASDSDSGFTQIHSGFNTYNDVAVSEYGDVVALGDENGDDKMEVYSSTGNDRGSYSLSNPVGVDIYQDIAVGADQGQVYFMDTNGDKIEIFNPSVGTINDVAINKGSDRTYRLAVAGDDELKVYEFDATTPISNLNINNPTDGDIFTYEETSNGITVDWSWDNPDSNSINTEVNVDGTNVYSGSTSGTSDSYTLQESDLTLGQTNTIEVVADDGNNQLTQTVDITPQNPQHTANTIMPSSNTVKMSGGSGVDWEYSYQYEAGETVFAETGRYNNGIGNEYSCNSGTCTVTESGTFDIPTTGVKTFGALIEGQSSGYSNSGTTYDVTFYDPSLTYDSPSNGATISYPNRNNIDLSYTWDSSNEESVTAYLYYQGNQIRSDNLSPGQSITESVEGDVGSNDWYVEVTGDTSGDTETFSTQSFTVEEPQNSLTLTNPSNNEEFDSGTSQVTVSTDYSVEEEGNVLFIINGVEEYSESVTVGSGSISFNYPTQSGEDVTWNASFEGTTGTNDTTSNTRSFSVLQSLASATPVSPTDGQTFSWNNRDVTFEWNSEANDDYTTRLYVDGTQESSSSYSRGSNVDTHTMSLGDANQDVTYNWYVETEDTNGNIDTSTTRTFTVEQPELSESATLTSPANESEFAEFLQITLEGEVESNDVSDWRLIVDGTEVKSGTVGNTDRTDTVTDTVSYTSSFNKGNHTWKIEIGNNESETRQFSIRDEILDFTYNSPTDGKVFREGVSQIDYSMDITHERNGTVSILKNGNEIYSETVNVSQVGTSETKTITYTESVNGNAVSVDWKGKFEDGGVFQDTNSSSYEIEELPSAVLDSPEDDVYFRNLPESVLHDFNISDTENEVTSELIVDGVVEETFTGSGQKSGIIDYLEGDIGRHNWTVNTTWTQDTGVEEDTELRKYNTGDPDIAEGRAVDRVIDYVSDQLGMSYLGAAILINLTLSMLFGIAVMYKTKSVGYTLLTTGAAFFGLGIIGFLPNILIILLGIAAVSVMTIYAWKATFGGDNE